MKQGSIWLNPFVICFISEWTMDQFHGLFTKLDQDKDGFISVAELHNEMKKHGILSGDGKVQVIFLRFKVLSVFRLRNAPGSNFIHFISFPEHYWFLWHKQGWPAGL